MAKLQADLLSSAICPPIKSHVVSYIVLDSYSKANTHLNLKALYQCPGENHLLKMLFLLHLL